MCRGAKCTRVENTCDYCDEHGTVSFARRILDEGDMSYMLHVTQLLVNVIKQSREIPSVADDAIGLIEVLSDVFREGRDDPPKEFADLLTDDNWPTLLEQLHEETSRVRVLAELQLREAESAAQLNAEEQRQRRAEVEQARLDQIQEAARRSAEHARIQRELEEKFGREAF